VRTLSRLFALVFVALSVAFVCGVFLYIYNLFTPKTDSGLFITSAGIPTPRAIEDMALYIYLQQHKNELLAPAGNDPTPVRFTIAPGDLPADVAARMEKQGLVSSAELFLNLIKYEKVGTKIQAGEYVLRKTMTMDEIIDAVQHGLAKMITVTIRPGWRLEESADYLAKLGLKNYNKDQFVKSARDGKFEYAFLKDRSKNASPSLEGFLFPESYNVPFDITNDALLTLMLDTFGQRVTDKTRQQIAAQKMTLGEALTFASIVEREAVVANERPIIASVFINRVKKKMFLQADSTAQYALGYQSATKQWWKSPVTIEELAGVNSPYNTYRNAGLPPGPICSPSLASIVAVAEPAQTEYLFFFSKGDGTHAFAKTFEEHQQNQLKYQK
jgi:UPF0755 protein